VQRKKEIKKKEGIEVPQEKKNLRKKKNPKRE
jgi:hypothetical protein